MLDSEGRVPPGQLILRLKSSVASGVSTLSPAHEGEMVNEHEETSAMTPKQADRGDKDLPANVWQAQVGGDDETIDEFVRERVSPFSGYDEAEELIYGDAVHEESEDFRDAEDKGPSTKAASPPPVSPSQISPTALSNVDKDVNELAIEIYEAEYITLEAWESALTQFGEVMNAVSDAEGTANFAGVLKKYIEDQLLANIAKQSKVVSAAKGVLDALVKENLRAEQGARRGTASRLHCSVRTSDYPEEGRP